MASDANEPGPGAEAPTQLHPTDFHASPGVGDWRVLFWGAHAFYRTASFAEAAAVRLGDRRGCRRRRP